MTGYVGATDSNSNPPRVKHIPTGNENGSGCLSVIIPTIGCSNDAVN